MGENSGLEQFFRTTVQRPGKGRAVKALILSAIAVFVYPKRSSMHRRVGKYFTISMLVMLVSGGLAGYLKESPDDVFLSFIVFYSVFTAWLTVFHKKGDTGLYEYVALAWIVLLGLVAFNIDPAWDKIRDPGIYPFGVGLAVFFLSEIFEMTSMR
jgi:uncharacterized membrane protein (UPF0136 family)